MIEIQVDYKRALKQLTEDGEKQIPFALSKAVNATVLDVQKAQRASLPSKFTLRRPEWALRAIKIIKFAKKTDPSAIIGIHPPGGDHKADLLAKFETDTQKLPQSGHIAIPIAAKRTKKDIVRANQRPRAIIASGKAFIIRRTRNPAVQLIVHRVGRGKRRLLETLYLLVKRVPLTANLRFEATARKTVDQTFEGHMVKEFDDAMRTAK